MTNTTTNAAATETFTLATIAGIDRPAFTADGRRDAHSVVGRQDETFFTVESLDATGFCGSSQMRYAFAAAVEAARESLASPYVPAASVRITRTRYAGRGYAEPEVTKLGSIVVTL